MKYYRYFFLPNLLLLLLYLWTLTEEMPIRIQVNEGQCEAFILERRMAVDCPTLRSGTQIGLYLRTTPISRMDWLTLAPLDWFGSDSAWASVGVIGGKTAVFAQDGLAGWQALAGGVVVQWGEARGLQPESAVMWQGVETADFTLEATLRRSGSEAGILLLEPGGDRGLAFIVSGQARSGVWWEWENGRLTRPLIGIPAAKPLLAQIQSVLRIFLRAHQGALLLLLVAWLIHGVWCVVGRLRVISNQYSVFSKTSLDLQEAAQQTHIIFQQAPNRQQLALYHQYALLTLCLVIFALSLHINNRILERVPHVQDSVTYLFQAKTLAAGRFWAMAPALPEFFQQEFLIVKDGRWFGKYPLGYPAILAIGVWLNAPWLVNPLLATLTVPLLYGMGASLYNRRTGFVTAMLCLASPFFWLLSADMMAHTAELFWLTLFMLAFTRAATKTSPHRLALVAGLAAGMAFLTRQLAAVAVVGAFTLLRGYKVQDTGNKWKFVPYTSYLVMWLPISLSVLFLLAYQGAITGDLWQDPRLLYWEYDRVGFGPEVGEKENLIRMVPFGEQYATQWYYDSAQPPRGHTLERGLHNLSRNWENLSHYLFGWPPLVVLGFGWLAFVGKRPSGTDWTLLFTILALAGIQVFYWHSGLMYGPRYLYAALPAFFLLTTRGMEAGTKRVGREGTAVLVLVLFIISWITAPGRLAAYRDYNFVVGGFVEKVETAVSDPAIVFVTPETGGWWEYGALFPGNSPWLDTPILFARDLGDEKNAALMALYPERKAYRFVKGEVIPINSNR